MRSARIPESNAIPLCLLRPAVQHESLPEVGQGYPSQVTPFNDAML